MLSCCNTNGWQLQIRLMMVIFQATIKPSLLTGPSGASFLHYNVITSVVLTVSWIIVYTGRDCTVWPQWDVDRSWWVKDQWHLRCCVSVEGSTSRWSDIRGTVDLIEHVLCCLWEGLTMEATPGLGKTTRRRKIPAVLQCFDLQAGSWN